MFKDEELLLMLGVGRVKKSEKYLSEFTSRHAFSVLHVIIIVYMYIRTY